MATFNYSGAPTTYTIPATIRHVQIKAVGAAGGNGDNGSGQYSYGGLGGMVTSTVPVVPGMVLSINVGGGGKYALTDTAGYNGGGAGGGGIYNSAGGGGMTTVTGTNIQIIAGGGGGGSLATLRFPQSGGNGGGPGTAAGQDGKAKTINLANVGGGGSNGLGGGGGNGLTALKGQNWADGGNGGIGSTGGGGGGYYMAPGGGAGYGGGGGGYYPPTGNPRAGGGGGGGSYSSDPAAVFAVSDLPQQNSPNGSDGYVVITLIYPPPPPEPPACFKSGAKILTDQGYRPIEALHKGDLIQTLHSGYKPVVLLGRSELAHPAAPDRRKDQLYLCKQAAYPELQEDLIITGCHSLLVDAFASDAQKTETLRVHNQRLHITENKYRLPACVDDRATVLPEAGMYTIYHLALEHENYYMNYGIYANGLLVETCSKRYLQELAQMTLID